MHQTLIVSLYINSSYDYGYMKFTFATLHIIMICSNSIVIDIFCIIHLCKEVAKQSQKGSEQHLFRISASSSFSFNFYNSKNFHLVHYNKDREKMTSCFKTRNHCKYLYKNALNKKYQIEQFLVFSPKF